MRTFIVYSATASTAPFIKDLKAAGRIDILLHSIISAMFASNTYREDTKLHLFLMGPPNAPRHMTIEYNKENTVSKKNLKKLVEIALRKAYPGKTKEVHPGVFVNDETIEKVVEKLKQESNNIYILDAGGDNIKSIEHKYLKNATFVLGDHDGFDKKTRKWLKKNTKRLSLGEQMYFTSQSITIINYELDNNIY